MRFQLTQIVNGKTVSTTPKSTITTIIPTLRYADAVSAIDWLCKAFGFEQHLVVPGDNGKIAHAQLKFGNGMIMLSSVRTDEFGQMIRQPADIDGAETQSPYLIVEDVDLHCEHSRSAGATMVMEPEDVPQGGRFYSCKDIEGHLWNFGTYDPWQ